MGDKLQHHDIYVATLLDQLNLRFAPSQGHEGLYGGVEEMKGLQREFEIFKKKRPFYKSVAALNLGGSMNNDVKNRWLAGLATLASHESNLKGQDGEDAVVGTIIKNLAAARPLPIHFTSHDARGAKANRRVIVTDKHRPLHYLEQDFIVISFPMAPHDPARTQGMAPPVAPIAEAPPMKAKKKPKKK